MYQKFTVYLTASKYDWRDDIVWSVQGSDGRKYDSSIVFVRAVEIEVDVPQVTDWRAQKIKALQIMRDSLRAEFVERDEKLLDQIKNLQALPAPDTEAANA